MKSEFDEEKGRLKVMSYYDYEDYYNEPSEFEQQIEEFKDSLLKAVKQEHKSKMERLEKENTELQDVKKNWKSLEREYETKIRELETRIKTADRDAKKLRLRDLMEELKQSLWQVNTSAVYKQKCDKCDDDRNISFASPSGKEMTEDCKCSIPYNKYSPVEYELYSFQQNSFGIGKWYKKNYRDEDYFSEDSKYVEVLIETEDDFKQITDKLYYIFFISKELCQKYCDIKNKENGITDDMVAEKYSHRPKKCK